MPRLKISSSSSPHRKSSSDREVLDEELLDGTNNIYHRSPSTKLRPLLWKHVCTVEDKKNTHNSAFYTVSLTYCIR